MASSFSPHENDGAALLPSFRATLPTEDGEALERIAIARRLRDGQKLCGVGGSNDYCAHVLSGLLMLQVESVNGRTQTVAILKAGDFFGQLYEDTCRITAIAAGSVKLCVYSRVALEQMAARRPAIMRVLLSAMTSSLEIARTRQISFAQKPTIARLAEFLLEQPVLDGVLSLSLNRTDLANYLGMPIETLSRQFSRLKQDRVIDVRPGSKAVRILNTHRLEGIAQD